MRVLLVEDHDQDADRLIRAVDRDSIVFDRAISKASADRLLAEGTWYELVICDLRIPAYDEGGERLPEHGLAVQAEVARRLPGTPLIFLTGVAETKIDDLSSLTSAGAVSDVFGDGSNLEMVRLFRKDRVLACAQEIVDFERRLDDLDSLALSGAAEDLATIGAVERRALGLAARLWKGTRADVHLIGGGYSGSKTLHARIYDATRQRASVLLKIDDFATCKQEARRYREFIDGALSHAAFPYLSETLYLTMGSQACLVYKFADEWDSSLFKHLQAGADEPGLVGRLRGLVSEWEADRTTEEVSVQRLRRDYITDELRDAAVLGSDDGGPALIAAMDIFEDRIVELPKCVQHGDFHAANVLCTPSGAPVIIDAGDVGLHVAGMDAFALELSLLVHPASHLKGGHWPSAESAGEWRSLDTYLDGCPHEAFVAAARAWALELSDPDTFAICAYIQLARQLKFDGAPVSTLLRMIGAVIR